MARIKQVGTGLEAPDARFYAPMARQAEELGFDSFWIAEDYCFPGAFSVASACAAATRKIKIGISVLNPYTRHPVLTAMELAALDQLSEGRAILGMGASLRFWIEDLLGIPYRKPVTTMREAIALIRALFRGQQLDHKGEAFNVKGLRFNLAPRRSEVPIYLGAMAPKALDLVGEAADGVLLNVVVEPEFVRKALQRVKRSAQRAGRNPDDLVLGGVVFTAMSNDEQAAREAVKPLLAGMLAIFSSQPELPIYSLAGIDPDGVRSIQRRVSAGQMPRDIVTEKAFHAFSVAGPPEYCRERLAELIDAGMTSPQLASLPVKGQDPLQAMRDLHAQVISHFL